MKSIVLAATLLGATLLGPAVAVSFAEEGAAKPIEKAVERLLVADAAALDRALASIAALERQAAAVVLGRRGESTRAQMNALFEATGDDAVEVRLAATRALGALGDAALPAAARLERLAGWASDLRQRHQAALALARIPGARENLLRLCEDPTQRNDTVAGLSKLGAEGRAALLLLADAPQWRTRRAAIAMLPHTADAATDADVRAALGRRLHDDSSAVRVTALMALPRIGGGALLTTDDVARVLAPDAPEPERRALLVALADDGTPGASTDPEVRAAAAIRAIESGSVRERLTGVRLAHAARANEEPILLALAAAACSDDVASAREAAACLRQVAAGGRLPAAVAAALRPATRHARARIAAESAAALARGGHDGPELAAPLTRLVFAQYWGGWRAGTMARPPYGWSRRNLRAGSGAGGIAALPAVPLLALDDAVALLRRHPQAAEDALAPYLAGEYAATRANAAWMAAEVCPAERVEALLLPLLDDPVLSVRLVAGLRLARLDAGGERIVPGFVETLLADDGGDDGEALFWDDELIVELRRDPSAAVQALVNGHAARAETVTVGEHESVTWSSPPGAHHVAPILVALGPRAHSLLVDELLAGAVAHRHMAAHLLGRVERLDPAAVERLRGLIDDPVVGPYARDLVGD